MDEPLQQRRQDRDARIHAALRRNEYLFIRNMAGKGIYYEKTSCFSDGQDYLPLDLWDQTKDE